MTTPANGNAKWQVWLSAAGVGFVILGAMFGLFMTATNAFTMASSLQSRVATMETLIHANEIEISVQRAQLTEIETQFRASDQVRNVMHANDLRVESMLWQKSFGTPYPIGNAYYPTIAQERPR